ncbi:hypothetical protein QFZ63_001575 [Streptomyces sp. B3I7]|uniref:hypothetical protein n=1 Tax=Streptomyces sp. B3I7 TaxID=3042269 RepID=UPI002780CE76|nr:hypothetical protein [Streptomyces sp. B3I7]MDQ0809861.1 hypothetical protein [Streptomyces sp. B3I7]
MTSTTAPRPPTTPADLPVAPLPGAARAALARLEFAFASQSTADRLAHEAASHVRVTPDVAKAVTRYEVASQRLAELSQAMDDRDLSGAEFDSLALAQDTMRASKATLAAAGQLHLIEAAR